MEIYNLHGSQSLSGPHFRGVSGSATALETPKSRPAIQDAVQFSEAAQKMSETGASESTSKNSAIRFDLVNRVRAEIAAGTYDTPEKMDAAIEKMLDRI